MLCIYCNKNARVVSQHFGRKERQTVLYLIFFPTVRDTGLKFEDVQGITEVKGLRTITSLFHSASIYRKLCSFDKLTDKQRADSFN